MSLDSNNSKLFEIGSMDEKNGKFIVKNIIEGNYKKIIEFVKSFGIKSMLNLVQNNIISSGNNNNIGYCYNIEIKDNEINEDLIMQDNQDNMNDILSFLIMLNKFEKDMKKTLELSKIQEDNSISNTNSNPFSIISCKLVSEGFITELKKLFNYKKLLNIIYIERLNFCS